LYIRWDGDHWVQQPDGSLVNTLPNVTVIGHRTLGGHTLAWWARASGAITQLNVEFDVILGGRLAYNAASMAVSESSATEGIYEFEAASGKMYVGQSGNIPARIEQHIASGKLLPGTEVSTTEVLGGKTAREIAEQLRINSFGGVKNIENIRNPIGAARSYLLFK